MFDAFVPSQSSFQFTVYEILYLHSVQDASKAILVRPKTPVPKMNKKTFVEIEASVLAAAAAAASASCSSSSLSSSSTTTTTTTPPSFSNSTSSRGIVLYQLKRDKIYDPRKIDFATLTLPANIPKGGGRNISDLPK
jgi:hypothetical protein